jgi:hypothetical protein
VTRPAAAGDDDHLDRLHDLLGRLRQLDPNASMGAVDDAPALRLRARRADVRRRLLAELQAEHDRGLHDLQVSLDAIVARAPARLRPPTPKVTATRPVTPTETYWSPTAIVGWRGWQVRQGLLQGAKRAWASPRYSAGCLRGRSEILAADVPHSNGECTFPPCGIYASKEPEPIVDMFIDLGTPIALGLVELTGKVVEHEYGYRAAAATAVAMVLVVDARMAVVVGAERVAELFARPESFFGSTATGEVATPARLIEALARLRRDRAVGTAA